MSPFILALSFLLPVEVDGFGSVKVEDVSGCVFAPLGGVDDRFLYFGVLSFFVLSTVPVDLDLFFVFRSEKIIQDT